MLSALDAEMRGDRKEMEKLARQAPDGPQPKSEIRLICHPKVHSSKRPRFSGCWSIGIGLSRIPLATIFLGNPNWIVASIPCHCYFLVLTQFLVAFGCFRLVLLPLFCSNIPLFLVLVLKNIATFWFYHFLVVLLVLLLCLTTPGADHLPNPSVGRAHAAPTARLGTGHPASRVELPWYVF